MIVRMTTQCTSKAKLGILMCGHSPEKIIEKHGRLDAIFANLLGNENFEYVPYFVVDNEFPESIDAADAWLITGSKHGAYEPLPWIKPLEAFIRDVYAHNIPMVGICFGHQVLAQALGGRVVKHAAGWVAGTEHYTFSQEVGVEQAVLNAWHQDQVVELPADARVVGSSPTCAIAAVAYRNNTVSIQPHPEFENDYVELLLAERGDALPIESRLSAESSLGQTLTNRHIANWLNQALTA